MRTAQEHAGGDAIQIVTSFLQDNIFHPGKQPGLLPASCLAVAMTKR
jgi:hypothetical protein